jgi:hypothetical protein
VFCDLYTPLRVQQDKGCCGACTHRYKSLCSMYLTSWACLGAMRWGWHMPFVGEAGRVRQESSCCVLYSSVSLWTTHYMKYCSKQQVTDQCAQGQYLVAWCGWVCGSADCAHAPLGFDHSTPMLTVLQWQR